MSGYNPNFQQGQYGNLNMRPALQRTNSSNQAFPPNPPQGNTGFNPNHLQQLSEFHNRQGFAGQQQGQYGNAVNVNYQQYGNNPSVQPQLNQQQQLRLQQQQYMLAAQQVRAQAQATQVPYRPDHSPRPPSAQLPHPLQAATQQAARLGGDHGNPFSQSYPVTNPQPMPMQRTFSNQSIPVQAPSGRPMLPVSGYQPHLSMGEGAGKPAEPKWTSPLPLTQVSDATSRSVTTSTHAPTAPRSPIEPPKKKRKKDEVVNTLKAKPALKRDEIPTPTVYFKGVEKPREEPVVKGVERPREQADTGTRIVGQAAAAPRRKPGDTESMRGSMRSEIARLMYAAGDVVEPRLDAVNYVEDLVVEFMADLCRPAPSVRQPGNVHTAPPLTASMIRYRLANAPHPCMIKYAARFDYMIGMHEEINRQKSKAEGSHVDIVSMVPTGYLGVEEEQERVGEKNGDTKRGRPKRAENGVQVARQKPGPKKGWKDRQQGSQVPEGKKRGPYKKRQREGSGVGTVKGEGYA